MISNGFGRSIILFAISSRVRNEIPIPMEYIPATVLSSLRRCADECALYNGDHGRNVYYHNIYVYIVYTHKPTAGRDI